MINSVVQGWINYYGRFYKSRLLYFLRRLNGTWCGGPCRKYKRLQQRRNGVRWLAGRDRPAISPAVRALAAGAYPDGWAMGAG